MGLPISAIIADVHYLYPSITAFFLRLHSTPRCSLDREKNEKTLGNSKGQLGSEDPLQMTSKPN